jgi:hypothetical protein
MLCGNPLPGALMKLAALPFATLAVVLAAASLPAQAASSASSASSEGSSVSVGSVSTSFETSSDSSFQKEKAASGDYKVIEVAEVAERPGMLRMKLQPVAESAAADGSFFLYLPAKTLALHPVAAGQVVSARTRPYVLHDDWYRELQSNAVVL